MLRTDNLVTYTLVCGKYGQSVILVNGLYKKTPNTYDKPPREISETYQLKFQVVYNTEYLKSKFSSHIAT